MAARALGWPVAVVAASWLAVAPAWAADVWIIKTSDVPSWRPALDAMRTALPGHTLTEHDLKGQLAEGKPLASLLAAPNRILVAMGPLAAHFARQEAPRRPLVYSMVLDPKGLGLLDAPDTAGVAFLIPPRDQLAAFRMVAPQVHTIGVIVGTDAVRGLADEAGKHASTMGLTLVSRAVSSPKDIPGALRDLLAKPVDAFWVLPDPALLAPEVRRHLLAEALKAGKPVFSYSATMVPEGALASSSPDYHSIGEKIAVLVQRVASGTALGKGEILVPSAELVINKKVADRLGLQVPAEAMKMATRVY